MAIFCYKKKDGNIVERSYPCGKAPNRIKLDDGSEAKRFLAAELRSVAVPSAKNWPLTCVASGVHPEQRQELSDYLKKKGVPTEISKDGDPVYRNAAHRRKALKARGMFDRAGYF